VGEFGPFLDVSDSIEQEDPLPLALANLHNSNTYRFHDPDCFVVSFFELFKEDWILGWKVVSERSIIIGSSLFNLPFFLQQFFIFLDVLRQ
jgi:hypothetical protein